MEEKLLTQNIQRLNISCNIVENLKENQITTFQQLCSKSSKDLKNLNISTDEIKNINLELQLLGLRLKNSF